MLDRIEMLTNRFWSRVDRKMPHECWKWDGPRTGSQGYGAFCFDSKYVYAHRFSFMLHNGPVPEGKVVMHLCDDPLCVNPLHLRAGTQGQNIRDSASKGRWVTERRLEHLRGMAREANGRWQRKAQEG